MSPPIDFGEDADGFVSFLGEGEDAKGEYRCADCGYGVVVAGPLPACPMCRGAAWEASPWNPFVGALETDVLR